MLAHVLVLVLLLLVVQILILARVPLVVLISLLLDNRSRQHPHTTAAAHTWRRMKSAFKPLTYIDTLTNCGGARWAAHETAYVH